MADTFIRLPLHLRLARPPPLLSAFPSLTSKPHTCRHAAPVHLPCRRTFGIPRVKVHAVVAEKDDAKWWEKNVGENMVDVNSPQEFLNVLNQSGDRLVIVEFYNTSCASCRGLFPKLCKTAEEHPEIMFIKVKFDENKPMCKRLNVRVLPYFHFYRGAEGLVEHFSCSLVQFQKMKDAIALHSAPIRVTGPAAGVGDLDLFNGSYPTKPRPNSR